MFGRIQRALPRESWSIPGDRLLSLRRLGSLAWFKLKRRVGLDYSFDPPAPSSVPIDLFMPVVEKDAEMLDLALAGVKEHVQHPIGTIYLVAPKGAQRIRAVAKRHGCTFIDEDDVLDLDKPDIGYVVNGENRNGWIYKMLLNLSADTICRNRHILILDADTVFIAPQIFLQHGRPLFNLSDEYHRPYFEATKRMVGIPHGLSRSFITHYMLFDAHVLKQLRSELERHWGAPWYTGIVNNIDKTELSGFADYEIYGDFYLKYGPSKPSLNYWSNISLSIKRLDEFEQLARRYAGRYRSISLHNYDR